MAKQSVATSNVDNGKVVFDFANGSRVVAEASDFADNIKEQLMFHGLVQKLRDSFAGSKGDANYAQAQCEATLEALKAGDWNRRGGGTGGTLLAEAVARVKGIDIADARVKVGELTEEQRESLKKAPSIVAATLEIQAERKQAKGGDDSALDLI